MKSIFFSLMILSVITFISGCKDSNVNPEPSVYRIKFIDAATKQPINNAMVTVYYGTEQLITATGAVEDVMDSNDTTLAIYPNPFISVLNFQFGILENANVKTEICDMNDEVVSKVQEAYYQAGINRITADANNFLPDEPNFYNLKIYKNSKLYQQATALYTPKWFMFGQYEEGYSIPFKTVNVNNSGIIELNKSDFKLISNNTFLQTDANGNNYGKTKVLDGCYCFIHYGDNYSSSYKAKIAFDDNKDITIEVSK